jgi:two-component system alkaline phosphatase synthesis response regulator PhoP
MQRKKILLVDDARTVLMMERLILDQPEFELQSAADGEQALERAQLERPDLILLDVVLPGLSGIEVCERLRADPATKSTPIVMVSTRGETQWIERARAAGCSDYVTKPLDARRLLEVVRRLLGAPGV